MCFVRQSLSPSHPSSLSVLVALTQSQLVEQLRGSEAARLDRVMSGPVAVHVSLSAVINSRVSDCNLVHLDPARGRQFILNFDRYSDPLQLRTRFVVAIFRD